MPTRPESPTDLPGADQRLGPYRLVRPVSAGGMARVYEGRLDSLAGVSTRVAIKVIHPDYAHDDGFQELFIAEARISSRLEHQNVVRVLQFNREGSLYYLVMEFIDGVTFRRLLSLARRGRVALTPLVVAELGRQAAEGLHYAHSITTDEGHPVGLVHRDVKPSNLMLTGQGVVKVLDFGISAAQGVEVAVTEAPAVKGTWGYMAPEQARAEPVGPAADLFGLAAVLYELAAGEPLFEDKDHERIREKLAADEGARKAAALAGPWRELGSVLVRALQRDPAARFPSAAAFARALSALVPDRSLAQEALIALVADAASAEPAPPGTTERPRSISTMAQVTGGGLPVAVGDARGPTRAPGGAARPARRKGRDQRRTSLVILVLLLLALAGLVGVAVLVPPSTLRGLILPGAPAGGASAGEGTGAPTAGGELGADGSTRLPDGTVLRPDGTVVNPDGTVRQPDGSVVRADGSVLRPDGSVVSPDGSVVLPDGSVLPPEGAPLPDGAAPSDGTPGSGTPEGGTATGGTPAGGRASRRATSARPAEGTGAAALQVGEGLLTVSSVPRAQVLVDGVYTEHTPLFQKRVDAGPHTIVLVADDGRKKTFQVDIGEGLETRRVWLFDDERWGE